MSLFSLFSLFELIHLIPHGLLGGNIDKEDITREGGKIHQLVVLDMMGWSFTSLSRQLLLRKQCIWLSAQAVI